MVQARAAAGMGANARGQRSPMGLIHRLDRDACGLLVFSKHDDAYQSLKKQFFQHTVERVYVAIVAGAPKEPKGRIESSLVEWKDGTVHSTKQRNKGEKAISHYEVCGQEGKYSLLRVKLETGRKHQIRVHLSEMGCPIVGDAFYGKGVKEGEQLMLVAIRLCLDHPMTEKRMEFELELPEHLRAFLRGLKDGAGK
jgi:RluA family pseudouridine synthase